MREGTYYILVHAYQLGGAFNNATLKVTTQQAPAEPFDLELVMVNDGTASQNAVIAQVAERYGSMIGLGAPDGS